MRPLSLTLLLALLTACSDASSPVISSAPEPDSPASPTANAPYRPVLAGTAYHGIGSKP